MTDVTNSETEAEARERLAKAVESFDGTDEEARKLSDLVLLAMGWDKQHYDEPCDWVTPDGVLVDYDDAPHPILNAQDALDLLPEDVRISSIELSPDGHAAVTFWRLVDEGWFYEPGMEAEAKTIQAAITAAALRAGS